MNITYLSYTGMNEPLGQSQVVPYLDILARFAKVRVISFEKDLSDNGNFLFDRFRLNKIRWTRKKYHKSPRLLATLYDVATMMYELVRGREKNKIQYIHCRGYVTAMAAFLYSIFSSNAKYIFDMRAFWPDEMVSANMLEKKSVLYMMLKKLEGELIARSYAVIVLTNAACEYLESHDRFISNKFYVIPTCVDYSKFQQIGHVGNLEAC